MLLVHWMWSLAIFNNEMWAAMISNTVEIVLLSSMRCGCPSNTLHGATQSISHSQQWLDNVADCCQWDVHNQSIATHTAAIYILLVVWQATLSEFDVSNMCQPTAATCCSYILYIMWLNYNLNLVTFRIIEEYIILCNRVWCACVCLVTAINSQVACGYLSIRQISALISHRCVCCVCVSVFSIMHIK